MSEFFAVYESEYNETFSLLIKIIDEYKACDSKNDKESVENYQNKFQEQYSTLEKMLKDMEMETRSFSSAEKKIFSEKIKSYRLQLFNAQKDYNETKYSHSTASIQGDSKSYQDRRKMIDGNERIRKQNELIDRVQMTVTETEEIGAETLLELQRNREVIESATQKTREMNAETAKSESILKRMTRRDWSLGFFS